MQKRQCNGHTDSKIQKVKCCSWVHPGIVRHLALLHYVPGERKITTQLFKTVVNLVNTSYLWHICQCGIVIIYLGTVSSRQEVQLVSTASPSLRRVLAGPAATSTTGSPGCLCEQRFAGSGHQSATGNCTSKGECVKGSVTLDSLYQSKFCWRVITCQVRCCDFILKQKAVALSLMCLPQAPLAHFLALSGNK